MRRGASRSARGRGWRRVCGRVLTMSGWRSRSRMSRGRRRRRGARRRWRARQCSMLGEPVDSRGERPGEPEGHAEQRQQVAEPPHQPDAPGQHPGPQRAARGLGGLGWRGWGGGVHGATLEHHTRPRGENSGGRSFSRWRGGRPGGARRQASARRGRARRRARRQARPSSPPAAARWKSSALARRGQRRAWRRLRRRRRHRRVRGGSVGVPGGSVGAGRRRACGSAGSAARVICGT